MTISTVRYIGGLRCEATHESGYMFQTDAPTDNHGKGEAFSPTDLIGTALASCILTTMAIVAEQHYKFDLGAATARVEKVMAEDKPRRIAELILDLQFALPADHPHRAALERVVDRCPVHNSLHPDMVMTVNMTWGAVIPA
jgi:putative redox protein